MSRWRSHVMQLVCVLNAAVGVFNRFRKPTQTAVNVPVAPAPEVPVRARIATFVVADGLGTLALESGEWLRYGRSACKGFEPVVDALVIVEEIAAEANGWKARVVTLAPPSTHARR